MEKFASCSETKIKALLYLQQFEQLFSLSSCNVMMLLSMQDVNKIVNKTFPQTHKYKYLHTLHSKLLLDVSRYPLRRDINIKLVSLDQKQFTDIIAFNILKENKSKATKRMDKNKTYLYAMLCSCSQYISTTYRYHPPDIVVALTGFSI